MCGIRTISLGSLAFLMIGVSLVADDAPVVIGDGAAGDPVPAKNCSVPTDKSCPVSPERQCVEFDPGFNVKWKPEINADGNETGLWYPEVTYGKCDDFVEDINVDSSKVSTCENSASKKDGTSIPEKEKEKVCFITRPCLSEAKKVGGNPRATIKWRIGGPNGAEAKDKKTDVYYYVCQPIVADKVDLPFDSQTTVKWQPCKAYANCLREFQVNPEAVLE